MKRKRRIRNARAAARTRTHAPAERTRSAVKARRASALPRAHRRKRSATGTKRARPFFKRRARKRRSRNAVPTAAPAFVLHAPALNLPPVPHYAAQQPGMRQQAGTRLSILYLVHAFYPESYTGTEKFVLQLARTMQQQGHRVKVIAASGMIPEPPDGNGGIASRSYIHEGIPVLAYRSRAADDPEAIPSFAGDPVLSAFADEILTREQPDILHVAHAMNGIEFMQSARKLGIPYIMTLTDFWFACPKSTLLRTDRQLCAGPEAGTACMTHCQIPYAGERLQALEPLLRSAERVLAPSVFLAAFMKSVMPFLNIEVLPHGMRGETIVPNEKTYRAKDPITLVYGGSLNEHKGAHILLEAMSMIPSRRLRLHVYGSGDPEYSEALYGAAAGDRRITFRGAYAETDLPRIYQEADIAMVPSVWYENYPLTLHEALASRVPVIASGVGGMAEKIVDGLNGYTFRVGDARHLAERLNMLLRNPALINRLKANIRQMPEPAHDAETAAYESIYFAHAR